MRVGLIAPVCTLIAACVLVYATPHLGAAMMGGDVKKELQTAFFHASELAQKGNAVAAAKLHVQHVLNCLEGTSGANFKKEAGYPCEGQGHGILPDLKDAAAARMPGADKALKEANLAWTLAVQAIAKNDVNEVQPWAKVVSQHLKAALDALES
jgi:hypothetical protein